MPKVSVIVPCYNYGRFILETLESVKNQTCQDYEIIVVNDGSTDPFTVDLLKNLDFPKTRVIHTSNQGLPAARNNGIAIAKAEIILPLDSDDKIAPAYIEKAVTLMESDKEIGIVYCKADFFGEKKGIWKLPPFTLEGILIHNLIFPSGFYRKSDWLKVGGYNSNMKYGWEDWDFWISIISLGRKVICIPDIFFHYRVRNGSMVTKMTAERRLEMRTQVFHNHEAFYSKNISLLFKYLEKVEKPFSVKIREGRIDYLVKGLRNVLNNFFR